MKWPAKKEHEWGETRQHKEFLIWPCKFEGYWYWLEWAIVEDWWMGSRWSRRIKIIKMLRP